jgi:hypothetical protein
MELLCKMSVSCEEDCELKQETFKSVNVNVYNLEKNELKKDK